MGRTQATAGFGVEIFVEKQQVAPVRITAEARLTAVAGAMALLVREEKANEPAFYLLRHFREAHAHAGTGGALDFEIIAVEVVVPFERFDEQFQRGFGEYLR